MRLIWQLFLVMLVALLTVSTIAGERVRLLEEDRVLRVQENRARLTASLLEPQVVTLLTANPTPTQTAALTAVLRNTVRSNHDFLGVLITDPTGRIVAQYPPDAHKISARRTPHVQPIGTPTQALASVKFFWSLAAQHQQVQSVVSETRVVTSLVFLALSVVFVGASYVFLVYPLKHISKDLSRALSRAPARHSRLMPIVGVEFQRLGAAVNTVRHILLERDLREDEMTAARQRAEQANLSKSAFLANMSHEIRTPMNGVIGMTELMKETELTDEQRTYVDTITSSGKSLLAIINDILDFSKIEAGKMPLQPEEMDLRDLLEDVVALFAAKARRPDFELAFRYDPDLPRLFNADAVRIRQIVTNILGNAVKFTHQGSVQVSVTGHQRNKSTYLNLVVRDTGIGIPQDRLKSIFKEFEQVHGVNSGEQGTGLGLAISIRLARLMGGGITARSTLNEGSTFTIALNLAQCEHTAQETLKRPKTLDGIKILAYDPLPLNRQILAEHLTENGADIQVCETLTLLLHALKAPDKIADHPDLLILNPITNRTEWADLNAALASSNGRPKPILFLSNDPKPDTELAGVSHHPSQVLQKPLRTKSLVAAVIGLTQSKDVAMTPPQTITSQTGPSAPSAMPTPIAQKQSLKLLVAEDNKTNQLVVRSMLRQFPAELRIVDNGADAVEVYKSWQPDLVLMDMSMPVMDGLEATQNIRLLEQSENTPRTAIIALTANAMSSDRDRCFEAGMDDYLSKPIIKNKLVGTLMDWAEKKGVAVALTPPSPTSGQPPNFKTGLTPKTKPPEPPLRLTQSSRAAIAQGQQSAKP